MDLRHLREAPSEPPSGLESHPQRITGGIVPPFLEPKYRAIAELGRGGMATVYLALAHGVGGFSKLVVLKCIRPEMASETEFVTMFMDEARLAACLSHPNIVQTNEVIDHEGVPVIVMEYLEGHTLCEILRRGRRMSKPIPLPMHLHILIEVLRGLHYAHEASDLQGMPLNLVHRDVSPQNILVTYSGEVKILDFGVAKSADASQETRTGVLKGKIRYMAPEQVLAASVDRRSDVYSVGVLLWQALAGRDFWQGQSDLDVMQAIVTEALPSFRDAIQTLPIDAQQLVAGALAYSPHERYPTAAVFGQKILDMMKRLGPRPETRDLELYMAELFSEDRERNRAFIADKIGRARDLLGTAANKIILPRQTGIRSLPLLATSATTQTGRDAVPTRTDVQSRSRFRLWIAGATILMLGLGAGLAHYIRDVHPMEVTQAASAPVATPQRLPVKVRISATPSDARLFLDGAPLPNNPHEEAIVPDGQKHLVRAELSGYLPRQETFELTTEVMVSIALEREAPPPTVVPARPPLPVASARTAVARHRVAAQASGSAAVPVPAPALPPTSAQTNEPARDCDPPYYTDPEGIRRVRPGCS